MGEKDANWNGSAQAFYSGQIGYSGKNQEYDYFTFYGDYIVITNGTLGYTSSSQNESYDRLNGTNSNVVGQGNFCILCCV